MNYILNSAVITTPGVYSYSLVSADVARIWLANKKWKSTIGYEETASALSLLTGTRIPVNRKMIKMKDGEEALVFRLTIRLSDPSMKGKLTPDFVKTNCEIGILRKVRKEKTKETL